MVSEGDGDATRATLFMDKPLFGTKGCTKATLVSVGLTSYTCHPFAILFAEVCVPVLSSIRKDLSYDLARQGCPSVLSVHSVTEKKDVNVLQLPNTFDSCNRIM